MMRNRPKVTHIVYGYDAEGRLSAVSCGGFTVNYAYNGHYGLYMCCYDAQGRLLFKDSPNGGDYLWDGWRMVKKQAWPWGGFGRM